MTGVQHQILAILFSDVVGYSKLMGENESFALSLLQKNREIHLAHLSKYQGKIIKEIGDGTLVVFSEAENAINYAKELIAQARRVHQLKLRIGIHIGEVSMEGRDIFGDGVNIASRIQTRARENQILVSEVVHDNLKNRGIQFSYLRKYQLKNIKHPVKCYALKGEGLNSHQFIPMKRMISFGMGFGILLMVFLIWYLVPESKLKKPDVYSIAVLPFNNMSGQPENQYFCDGIMEDILTQLSYVPELQVTSRTSSMKYLNATMGIPVIARQLGVNFILEGSVRRDSSSVLVTVQLIDARDDSHLWSGRYIKNLTMENLWDIQNEIAENVAENLEIKISPYDTEKLNHKPTLDYDAYDYYLKGKEYYRRYYPEDNEIAIQLFKKAVGIDSSYALAYAGLADAFTQKVLRFDQKVSLLDSAEYYAKLSILYDESLPEGFKTLGLIERTKNNLDLAISYTRKAVSLNPNYTDAVTNLGFFLITRGLFSEGMPHLQHAILLNPRDPEPLNYMGVMYYFMGDFTKSKMFYSRSMELEPDNRFALLSYLICLDAQQDWTAYESFSNKALTHTQDTLSWHWNKGILKYYQSDFHQAAYHFEMNHDIPHQAECLLRMADSSRAINMLEKINTEKEKEWLGRRGIWSDFYIANSLTLSNLLLDEPDKACEWLKISLKEGRDHMYRMFTIDPIILNRSLPACMNQILSDYAADLHERTRLIQSAE